MEIIKDFIVDNLNGFSSGNIPLYLFQLVIAALAGLVIQLAFNKKFKTDVISHGALIGAVVAFITSIAKNELVYAVLAATVLLLFSKIIEKSSTSVLGNLLIISVALGCGVGSVIQSIIGFVFILLVLLFTPVKK
ncbi:hypothetical protein N8987_07355 [Crocinitomix sp.]|nr:hypothetical protein [Crocinitomix sp.]